MATGGAERGPVEQDGTVDKPFADRSVIARIQERLAQIVGKERFERSFQPAARIEIGESGLVVRAQSAFHASWLEPRFGAALLDAAREVLCDPSVSLEWVVAAEGERAGAGAAGERPVREGAAAQEAGPEPVADVQVRRGREAARVPSEARAARSSRSSMVLKHRLDEFVVGGSNRLAFEAAGSLAELSDAGGFRTLFVHGECGLGKTHLLQGLAARALERRPGAAVRYLTGEAFTNEYVQSVRRGKIDAFRAGLRRLDLLCIDDVHFISGKTKTQGEFLHTFEALGMAGARVALASDHHPREIEKLGEHLISRCLSGMVVRVDRPDTATRTQIVRSLAARRGLLLEPGAAESIAANCHGSVRDIEGALARVEAMVRLMPEAPQAAVVGASVVKGAFAGATSLRRLRPIKVITIAGVVCRALNVELSELFGDGRHKRVVLARSLTAYLARLMTTHSFPEIAQEMKRPNHSTIITACQRMKKQIDQNHPCECEPGAAPMPAVELCERLQREILSFAQAA